MRNKYTLLAVVLLIAGNAMGVDMARLPRLQHGANTYQINRANQALDVYQDDVLIASIVLSPNTPAAFAITPDGTALYVGCDENVVHVIDAVTNTIRGVVTSPLIEDPVALAMSVDGTILTVYNQNGSTVAIDTATNMVIQ